MRNGSSAGNQSSLAHGEADSPLASAAPFRYSTERWGGDNHRSIPRDGCFGETGSSADRGGLLRTFRTTGEQVKVGEVLGAISDPFGQTET